MVHYMNLTHVLIATTITVNNNNSPKPRRAATPNSTAKWVKCDARCAGERTLRRADHPSPSRPSTHIAPPPLFLSPALSLRGPGQHPLPGQPRHGRPWAGTCQRRVSTCRVRSGEGGLEGANHTSTNHLAGIQLATLETILPARSRDMAAKLTPRHATPHVQSARVGPAGQVRPSMKNGRPPSSARTMI